MQILRKEKKYQGYIIDVSIEHFQHPSGTLTSREIVEHPGGSVVLPVFENGDILLIQQYRHPIGKEIIELPAGKLDYNEDPQHCAARELQEETGYTAHQWTKLTTLLTTPGFCNEHLHIYLAQNLFPSPHGQALEEGEQSIKLLRIPLDEAIEKIYNGVIVDGKSIVGIMLGKEKLRKL